MFDLSVNIIYLYTLEFIDVLFFRIEHTGRKKTHTNWSFSYLQIKTKQKKKVAKIFPLRLVSMIITSDKEIDDAHMH